MNALVAFALEIATQLGLMPDEDKAVDMMNGGGE